MEAGEKGEVAVTGSEVVNGIDSHLVTVKMKSPDRKVVYAIAKNDLRIHRSVLTQPLPDGQEVVQTNTLSDIKLNTVQTAADFRFVPPTGMKEYVPPDYRAKLVKVGQKAPEFTLPTPSGGNLSLADGLSRKKALLINFWFYN
jgi:hypothetical protein